MSARLVNGILCDYTVAQTESRLAMDRALPHRARKGRPADKKRLRIAVDVAIEASQIETLVPHYNRL
jgi:hypothetical protein